jgi:T-complex protein 1 subunit zeta
VPGAGAFEIFAWQELQKFKDEIKGKSRLGIQAFAEALLIIPKTICKFFFLTLNNLIIKL